MQAVRALSSVLLLSLTATTVTACEHRGREDQVAAKPSGKAGAKPGGAQVTATKPSTDGDKGGAKEGLGDGTTDGNGTTATKPPVAPPPTPTPMPDPPDPDGVRPPTADDLAAYTKDLPGKGDKIFADIKTSLGTLTCELHDKLRPITVANFIGLATGKHTWRNPKTQAVEKGTPYFDGLAFHRIIKGFMIQGGDPLGTGTGGPGYRFVDEFGGGLTNGPGSLAMANAGKTTNGSQFFINEVDNRRLDPKHTVFGQCAPLSLVQQITSVEVDGRDRPVTPVVMEKVTIRRGK
jgi:peptidyl-prolyl cis-trans isomerase A (cyclophilin A)